MRASHHIVLPTIPGLYCRSCGHRSCARDGQGGNATDEIAKLFKIAYDREYRIIQRTIQAGATPNPLSPRSG
jgi:hypothetical protein